MAVVNETGISGPLYANGVTTVFPFDFTAASADEIEVTVDGIAIDADEYVVTLADDFTGSVTISPALAAGEIYIQSIPSFKQETVFQRYGPFYPDQTNAPFDRAAIRDIWLKSQIDNLVSLSLLAVPQEYERTFTVSDATQSIFTLSAAPRGRVFVFLNGVKLSASTYVQNGLNITLVDPAVTGDIVTIVYGQSSVQPTIDVGNVVGFLDALSDAAGAVPSRDFAVDLTGVQNAATLFDAMFAAGDAYNLFAGSYRLNSDVGLAGSFSWDAQPGVAFVGTGLIDATDYEGFNYTPDLRGISWARTAGSIAIPKTSPHAVAFVGANSNTVDTGGRPNPALAVQHNMFATAGQARAQAIYAEAIARVSGGGTFVEGLRAHGIVPDGINSKSYGVLSYAQNGGTGANCIATESEIRRTSTVTVSTARDWTGAETWDGMYLATANSNNEVIGGPGSRPNFGFALNPYSTIAIRTGFLIPKSLQAGGKTVDHTAFANLETGLVYGLDLAKGSYSTAAIALPNNSTIRAYNAAGAAEHNLLYYDTSNRLVLGEEAVAGVFIKGSVGFQGAAPIAKPTITGSRGGNAALTSVLTQLAAYGLITDGTTA